MRKPIVFSYLTAATVVAVAACSGGGGGNQGPPPNTAPTIAALGDVAINQDTPTTALALNVTDRESPASSLAISVKAADNILLPVQGIVLSGSAGAQSLTLTPAESATGSTVVTVTATDPQGSSTSRSFNLAVNAVSASFTQFTKETFAVAADESSRSFIGFTLDNDADEGDDVFGPLLQ